MPNNDDDDDNDDDVDSIEEGFRLLLGNDIISSIDATAWDNESCENDDDNVKNETLDIQKVGSTTACHPSSEINQTSNPISYNIDDDFCNELNNDIIYSLAYNSCIENGGKTRQPSVKIVNMGLERGNGLIATQHIVKNSVIYTERAAVATLADISSTIACCYNCFRSMEPITSCHGILRKSLYPKPDDGKFNTKSEEIIDDSESSEFPYPHLWPVLPFIWKYDSNDKLHMNSFRHDKYGRMQCRKCSKLFCSEYCRKILEHEIGSCCLLSKAIDDTPNILHTHSENNNQHANEQDECDNVDNYETDVQTALLLAIRMFAHDVQTFRTKSNKITPQADVLNGLCGSDSELNELEIGIGHRHIDNENEPVSLLYTIEPIYQHLVKLYQLTDDEQQKYLPYSKFAQRAAQAARNGFGIATESPFQSYYSALIRTCGRGTIRHEQASTKVAKALGVVKFDRTMDKGINEHVAPQVVAIFPLTARINHACTPSCNAEVRSGQFVDYHIDLVSQRDIYPGEEILISYIQDSHRKRRPTRQRELQAKYLFLCNCLSCQK